MRLKVQYATREHIIGAGAVKAFFYLCVHDLKLGIGFHPDTRFEDYIFKTGKKQNKRVFTNEEAEALNNTMNECHNQDARYNVDVYEIGLNVIKPLLNETEKPTTPQVNIDPRETQIASVHTDQTGGHIYNDVIELKNGYIIRISSEGLSVYKNAQDDETGENGTNVEFFINNLKYTSKCQTNSNNN